MGRSKSRGATSQRGFSKVVPIESDDFQDMAALEDRKRVNFNINRVVAMQPGPLETDSDFPIPSH